MAKTQKVELHRTDEADHCYLSCDELQWMTPYLCWSEFRYANPIISKGLRKGQSRKLVRTQLKNGFKLEIA